MTRSHKSRISSSRCETYKTAMPSARSLRTILNRVAASCAEREAVGSSMTIRRALRTSARQIETSPRRPVLKLATLDGQREIDAEAACRRHHLGRGPAPVDQAQARGLGQAQHDVLQGAELADEMQFLMDEAEPEDGRLVRRADRDRPAVEGDRAAVGLLDPGQDADQGRLAGTVGADQPVHLAGAEVDLDAAQGLDARRSASRDRSRAGTARRCGSWCQPSSSLPPAPMVDDPI